MQFGLIQIRTCANYVYIGIFTPVLKHIAQHFTHTHTLFNTYCTHICRNIDRIDSDICTPTWDRWTPPDTRCSHIEISCHCIRRNEHVYCYFYCFVRNWFEKSAKWYFWKEKLKWNYKKNRFLSKNLLSFRKELTEMLKECFCSLQHLRIIFALAKRNNHFRCWRDREQTKPDDTHSIVLAQ